MPKNCLKLLLTKFVTCSYISHLVSLFPFVGIQLNQETFCSGLTILFFYSVQTNSLYLLLCAHVRSENNSQWLSLSTSVKPGLLGLPHCVLQVSWSCASRGFFHLCFSSLLLISWDMSMRRNSNCQTRIFFSFVIWVFYLHVCLCTTAEATRGHSIPQDWNYW